MITKNVGSGNSVVLPYLRRHSLLATIFGFEARAEPHVNDRACNKPKQPLVGGRVGNKKKIDCKGCQIRGCVECLASNASDGRNP